MTKAPWGRCSMYLRAFCVKERFAKGKAMTAMYKTDKRGASSL